MANGRQLHHPRAAGRDERRPQIGHEAVVPQVIGGELTLVAVGIARERIGHDRSVVHENAEGAAARGVA